LDRRRRSLSDLVGCTLASTTTTHTTTICGSMNHPISADSVKATEIRRLLRGFAYGQLYYLPIHPAADASDTTGKQTGINRTLARLGFIFSIEINGIQSPAMENTNIVLRNALQKLLKPLIRILLRYGYSYHEFSDVAKQVFVDVCIDDFAIKGRKMTASRVAVLTGMDRKEIVKLINKPDGEAESTNRPINRASRVIGGWQQDKDFRNKKGEPLVIPVKGDGVTFQALVRKYGGDITYGPILEELLRINAVQYIDENKIKLIAEGYLPLNNELEKLKIMGDSACDLLTSINYNLDAPKYPRFQRQVIYLQLSQNSINEFKLVSHDKCQNLLLEFNEWLAGKLELDTRLEVTKPHSRVGVGIYYIEDEPPKEKDE